MRSFEKADGVRVFTLILASLTAVAITVFTVMFGDGKEALIVVPLYISILILFLQSGVNRWAFLLGAINSLFYAAVYIYDGLYLTAIYAAAFSFPFQLWTFFRWKRRDSSGKTIFMRLGNGVRVAVAAGFAVSFAAFYMILQHFGSDWGFYDCWSMLLGILVTVLCVGPYIEYSPLQCLSVFIGLIMFAKMARQQPIQYTYLAYQVYSLFCVLQAFVRIIRIYRRQKNGEETIGFASDENDREE